MQSPSEVYSWKRRSSLGSHGTLSGDQFLQSGRSKFGSMRKGGCASLLAANQMVRCVPAVDVPFKDIYPKGNLRKVTGLCFKNRLIK